VTDRPATDPSFQTRLIADIRRLCELMPAGRVRIHGDRAYGVGPSESLFVISDGHLHRLCTLTPEKYCGLDGRTLLHLEYTLREECRARGWPWATGQSDRPYASVRPETHRPPCFSDSTGHAFVLEMIRELERLPEPARQPGTSPPS